MRVPNQDTPSLEQQASYDQQPKSLPNRDSNDETPNQSASEAITGESSELWDEVDEQGAFAPSRSKSAPDVNFDTKIAVFSHPSSKSHNTDRKGIVTITPLPLDRPDIATSTSTQEAGPWRAQDDCLMAAGHGERSNYNFHIGMANTAEVLREQRPLAPPPDPSG
jgi:hypothetical protein